MTVRETLKWTAAAVLVFVGPFAFRWAYYGHPMNRYGQRIELWMVTEYIPETFAVAALGLAMGWWRYGGTRRSDA